MMPNEKLHGAVQAAAEAIAPGDRHSFQYADVGDTETHPGYAYDVLRVALSSGYPYERLRESLLDIAERTIAYRRACLDMCEDLIGRMRADRAAPAAGAIDPNEFPSTHLGRALNELHLIPDSDSPYLSDVLGLLQESISDHAYDHRWGQRLAHALLMSIEPPPQPLRGGGRAGDYATSETREDNSREAHRNE